MSRIICWLSIKKNKIEERGGFTIILKLLELNKIYLQMQFFQIPKNIVIIVIFYRL